MGEFRGWGGAALVTGGSEGIGFELARQFAMRRINVLLVARSASNLRLQAKKLASAHGVRAEWIDADLASADGIARLMERLRDVDMNIDVLVNNAAFGINGGFGSKGPAREGEMLRLNVAAPAELTANVLPGMIRRRRGLILNVGSTAGFRPVTWIGTYAASKSFLLDWTLALDCELRGTGVRAAILCPGTTSTNFHVVSGAVATGHKTGVFGQQSAAQVAEACMKALDRGRRVIVPGPTNQLHQMLTWVVPRWLAAEISWHVIRPKARAKT
jgi:short-subunit dehydrogenase